MSFKDALVNPDPKPGELLEELRPAFIRGDVEDIQQVSSLDEQNKVASDKLEYFLSNISDTPGAVQVVEQFYEEKHDSQIDATEVDELKSEISSIQSIIKKNKLPVFSKTDLREDYGVEGGWEDKQSPNQGPYLVPDWVESHNKEPYYRFQTSGTTSEPWNRLVTRNDWALYISNAVNILDEYIRKEGISPGTVNVAFVNPREAVNKFFSQMSESLGFNVKRGDFNTLMSGGEKAQEEAKKLIEHVNDGEKGMLHSPVQVALKGPIGVALRRKEIDLDFFFNVGQVLTQEARKKIEKVANIINVYAESEYPQGGGPWTTIDGVTGFDLPLDSQINLVYDEEEQELKREGTGRFGYIAFGLEGQILPGVYMSGIKATIETAGNEHQILKEVNRIDDPDRGCSEINNLIV